MLNNELTSMHIFQLESSFWGVHNALLITIKLYVANQRGMQGRNQGIVFLITCG